MIRSPARPNDYNEILVDIGSQISAWDSDALIRFMLVHTYDKSYSMGQAAATATLPAGLFL